MWQTIKRSLINKWDWWVLDKARHTLFRMCHSDPAFAYLMKLQIEEWQERMSMPDELKKSTEKFHDVFRESAFSYMKSNKINHWR